MYLIKNMFNGFCMALADSVPGVSGGTIAFIMGFYDDFIGSLNALIVGSMEEKKKALRFLSRLGIGWVIGFCGSVLVLGGIFDSHIYQLSSLFMGLTLFSIPVVLLEEKDSLKGSAGYLVFTVLGVAIVAGTTYLGQVSGSRAMDISSLNPLLAVYILVAAMVAISAMVLPGISGSTLLLIFGLYVPIISGIKEVLHFHFAYVPALLVFGCGIIAGILTTIRLVKLGLEKFRPQMIYLILGLMLGSLYAIAMGPTTLNVPQSALTWHNFHVVYFLIGGALVTGLEMIKCSLEKGAKNYE